MVRPSAAMAMASSTVSTSMAVPTTAGGSRCSELMPATATNPNANHGTTIFARATPGCAARPRASSSDSATRNGASIITRTILAITAVSAAPSLTARPAATTWATSCTVEPVNTP
ncbi:hypothetical protein D9M71_783520 [compost metagenome]